MNPGTTPKQKPPTDRKSLARARELRETQTKAEAVVWKELRNRKLGGFKFRRQVPLGGFFADFYCDEAGLAVELDGFTHVGREDRDTDKDAALAKMGVEVLRLTNFEVHRPCSDVLQRILAACERRSGREART